MAFSGLIAGVFTLESGLDGPDILADPGAFAGTFLDITDDVEGDIIVTAGTDKLAGSVQASSLTASVSRPLDPGYWNPNNPASPLNGFDPGFEDLRPGRLIESTADATEYGVFYGFLRRAPWRLSTRSCQLYFEDLLFRGTRVWPIIASTGPTTTGAAIGRVLDAMGWTWSEVRSLAVGDALDDFSADGSQTALQLIGALVEAERGGVYIRGDGVFVYESRDMVQTRDPSGTLSTSTNLEDLDSGVDADFRFTRVTVTRVDAVAGDTVWTSIDTDAEDKFGRSEAPAISSPYVPLAGGQNLADDIVFEGSMGKPPVTAEAFADDDSTLALILSSPLRSLFNIDDPIGGTEGDYVMQGVTHRLSADNQHRASYTLTKRAAKTYTLDSELDGSDVFRY